MFPILYNPVVLTVNPALSDETFVSLLIRPFQNNKRTNSVALVRERTIPTSDRRLSAKLVRTFAYRGCPCA
jgi:hypothetical protein